MRLRCWNHGRDLVWRRLLLCPFGAGGGRVNRVRTRGPTLRDTTDGSDPASSWEAYTVPLLLAL